MVYMVQNPLFTLSNDSEYIIIGIFLQRYEKT